MARTLTQQAVDLEQSMADLVKRYQFRDRRETVAYGLSVSQAYTLRALHENGALTMGELAAELRLTVSTLTRVVDQLVVKQLVDRVRGVEDRRICQASLTRAGRQVWRRIQAELVASDREVLRDITPGEREVVIRVIGQLTQAVDAWRRKQAEQGG